MPLYEYQCDDCGHRFELIRKFSDDPVRNCPSCAGSVRKLLSSPAIQFKGTGWYVTDYARKSDSSDAQPASGEGKSGSDAADAPKKESKKTDSSKTGSSPEAGSKTASTPSPAAASD